MKLLRLMLSVAMVTGLFTQCDKNDPLTDLPSTLKSSGNNGVRPDAPPKGTFTVTIKNVSTQHKFFESGVQAVPVGESSPGPAFPGQSFLFTFHAGKGHKLSFATMYGASNDLFYAPSGVGIDLFTGDTPLTGDITSLISLWDAGTETNMMPGSGLDGAPESLPIKSIRNIDNVMDGYDYNTVEGNIEVTLIYDGTSMFTLTIKNLDGSTTPLSPVAWVVHTMPYPIFEEGLLDYGKGLENLAETGNASILGNYLAMNSGYVSPVAPGVWVVHKKNDKPIFTEGIPDYGKGLENLSETGDPSVLAASLMAEGYQSGVYNTPDGAGSPAPLFPGESYTFMVDAKEGDYVSFASMLGKSNDLFFAPDDMGIKLFHGIIAADGDYTSMIKLWDAGTEANEYPGAGIHQGPGGIDKHENVMMVNDGFTYPDVSQIIKVTITRNPN